MSRALAITLLVFLAHAGLFPLIARAHAGWGIVADPQRRVIYFLDGFRSRLWRMDARGKATLLAADKHANNLAVDETGNLYVDHFSSQLLRVTPEGVVGDVLDPHERPGTPGSQRRKLLGDWAYFLARDRQGDLYFCNSNRLIRRESQILKLSPTGQLSVLAGGTRGQADGKGSEAQFGDISSAAWGPDGALYLTDGNTVRKLSPDGVVTTLAGSAAAGFADGPGSRAQFHRPLGLDVDAQGNVYVADYGNRRIRKISPRGEVTTLAGSGWFWRPLGIAVVDGQVYVQENDFLPLYGWVGPRVRRVSADGDVATLATVWGPSRVGVMVFSLLTVGLAVVSGMVLGARKLRTRLRRRS